MTSRKKLLNVFFIVFTLIGGMSSEGNGQSADGKVPFDLAIEFQVYPTGFLPGIRGEWGFSGKHAVGLRAGYNIVRHGDAGEHEDERGGGPGFSLGYKRYFAGNYEKWFLGIRSDLWLNAIDWKDNIGTAQEIRGNTDIVVLQPTLEFGFAWTGKNQPWLFSPFLAGGYEINIVTEGEPTGEGPILLIGVLLGYRL